MSSVGNIRGQLIFRVDGTDFNLGDVSIPQGGRGEMSHEAWTVERLDALPEETVVEWSCADGSSYLIRRSTRGWNWEGLEGLFNSQAFTDQGSIRVVSVPIDALLSDETVDIAQREAWVSDSEGYSVSHGIRAAVAHITGGAA